MNILILGGGGREHALAWKINQSDHCKKLFIAPGNAGTAQIGTNVALNPNDFVALSEFALQEEINMIIVGPEEPLVRGIWDYFQKDDTLKHIPVIGPSAKGAQLEGSKAYAKQFMADYNIPTAGYREFTSETLQAGLDYIAQQTPPIVLKADGLAAGKGVLILDDITEAQQEFKAMLEGKFGQASHTVVIEEFLDGIEFSVFVLTDGTSYKILPVAKDYKRIGEGDTGLNTGGMGAISPVSFVDDALMKMVEEEIVQPTMVGLKERAIDYQGFIFIGLIRVDGKPYVIEYNCRMGDPETEVVIPRIKNDLVEVLQKVAHQQLESVTIEIDKRAATTVVLVSGGYPEAYEKGKLITGTETIKDSIIFHAGTKFVGDKIVTNGGRVMALTSYGTTFKEAIKTSMKNAQLIQFDKKNYRTDIGFDL